MRKPSNGSVGAFVAALTLVVVLSGYGHTLWGNGNAFAPLLLALGYGLLVVSVVIMIWEHLVRRPAWPEFRWPIAFKKEPAAISEGSLSPGPDVVQIELLKGKAEFYEREYKRTESELTIVTAERDDLREKLAPPKQIALPDERMIILFRTYGKPAFESLHKTLRDSLDDCYSVGGWPGLFARMLSTYGLDPAQSQMADMENVIEGKGRVGFDTAFSQFYWNYNAMMGHAYQIGSQKRALVLPLLTPWLNQDSEFAKELNALSNGVNRESLKNLVRYSGESRSLLRKLLQYTTDE